MFIIKSYSRKELAQLYFPDLSSRSAYVNFRNWLLEYREKYPDLLTQLHGRRIFRKCDVVKIVELLGEP